VVILLAVLLAVAAFADAAAAKPKSSKSPRGGHAPTKPGAKGKSGKDKGTCPAPTGKNRMAHCKKKGGGAGFAAYFKCLSKCAAKDPSVAGKGKGSLRSHFKAKFAACKAGGKCKAGGAGGKQKPTAAGGKSTPKKARFQQTGATDPLAGVENMLVMVLRGVDLAEKVLDGQGKKIWQELRCPACQCAVLRLYQDGCAAAAKEVCHGVSDAACGPAAAACNAVICPAIDPLFSKQCMNIVSAISKIGAFSMVVPYQVCTGIHMCFPSDENFGLPPPSK